jgi:AcrR family transcriptional regulator
MANGGQRVKGVYRSPLRQRQAHSTRLAIIEAAGRLFAQQGYVSTSIDQIAAEAGVSRATVFSSVGSKSALLKTAYDVALVGDDEPVPLPERDRSRRIQAEPDSRRFLALYAELVTEIDGRTALIYEAVRGAASADDGAQAVWDKIQRERRTGAGNVVRLVVSKGGLRADLDAEGAADVFWVLNDPGLYHLLVDQRRWPPDRFSAWLAETLQAQLLVASS